MTGAKTLRTAVLGASGLAGAELLRLAAHHPGLEVVFASSESQSGVPVGRRFPGLAKLFPELHLQAWADVPEGLDVALVALPHGLSQSVIPKLDANLVVDLGADFRFDDPAEYAGWYGLTHSAPELLPGFTYGMVELNRQLISTTNAIAVPGCYVTAAILTMAPLLAAGVVEPAGIVVDAASGVSGAGRDPKPETMFTSASEDFTAYGLLHHRHTREMEIALSRLANAPVELLFTPHLAPMNRGILATCYLRPTADDSTEDLLHVAADFYEGEPFIHISDEVPHTKATLGSNSVHMTFRKDERTGWVVALGALDNLIKGAAGHAIQGLNVALGFGEQTGLETAGSYS